jgi:hypothetical protein
MKRITLIALTLIIVVLAGCKKDEETQPKTNTDLLIQHTWKTSALTVDPSIPILDNLGNIIGYTNDLWAQLPDCVKDNFYKYNADGTFVGDEGPTKCEPDDPQNATGTWVFNSDETIMTETDSQGNSTSYNVIQLDENTFKGSYTGQIEGVNYTITITNIPK